MTKREGLFFEMDWPQGLLLHFTHQFSMDRPLDAAKRSMTGSGAFEVPGEADLASVLELHAAARSLLLGTVIDEAGCSHVLASVPHGLVDG